MNTHFPVIDGHAHLSELNNLKREIDEARRVGVRAIIGVGMDIESNRQTLALAEAYPGFVLPAVGYHPWEVREGEIEKTLAFVEAHIDRCVAIGEVGIDYKVKVRKPLQREVFGQIVDMAVRHDKALILHCRYSHKRVLALIREAGLRRAIFHWYTGPPDLLREIVSAGYYVSATPSLRRSPPHQEGIRKTPLERILVETDCPVIHTDRASRPSDVITTVEEVARIKGVPVDKAAEVIFQNTLDFFELPPIDP